MLPSAPLYFSKLSFNIEDYIQKMNWSKNSKDIFSSIQSKFGFPDVLSIQSNGNAVWYKDKLVNQPFFEVYVTDFNKGSVKVGKIVSLTCTEMSLINQITSSFCYDFKFKELFCIGSNFDECITLLYFCLLHKKVDFQRKSLEERKMIWRELNNNNTLQKELINKIAKLEL